MWKTVSSKTIFSHPKITLIEDEVELPSGLITKYLKFSGGIDAAAIIAKRNNKILISKEYSYPPNKVLWQFPGGAVSKNENIEVGANRELMEETGYRASKLTLLGRYLTNNRRSSSFMYVFLGTELEKASKVKDVEEEIQNFWLSEKEIDNLIVKGDFENGYSLAAWCLYRLKGLKPS